MTRLARVLAPAAAVGGCCALAGASSLGSAAGAGRGSVVEQMVVFRSGKAVTKRTSSRAVSVRVGRRRCKVGTGTALAALVRSRVSRVRLRDFGSCSRRARDAGQLFVTAIGRDRNRGQSGWVYKVGRRGATAGAGDPRGPFGRGRLRSGQRVVWFYCLRAANCQRTLSLRARAEGGGAVTVSVVGYDDEGRGVKVAGAEVHVGAVSARTDAKGVARASLPPGRYRVHATKKGLVRSFPERVLVR